MMGIVRVNQLPEGSGSLTNDDIFLFMDDPLGSAITKKIALSEILSTGAKSYGSFYDTTTQVNASTTGINIMTFSDTDLSYNIAIVSGSRLTFNNAGVYNIQFSAQVEKTDGGDDAIDIWINKNGNLIPWTNTRLTLHQQDAKAVPSWNFFVSVNSNDYIELKWHSADIDMRILAESGFINPIRPDIPSIILTATQVN
jgi:hypothetical protein